MAAAPMTGTLTPDKILHEFSELWTSTAKAESGDGNGVLRACSMTLIAFVDDEEDAGPLGETIALLMRSHPARAIVIRLREDPDHLKSRVFAQCWMPFGHNQQVCCEQVELTVSLNRLEDGLSIVSPLEAADLPRVVWIRAARLSRAPDLSGVLKLGDKLIVDSARPGAPAFADLRALVSAGLIVGDLAWTRITHLRQLLAQLLEGRSADAIRKVVVEHCGAEPGPEAKYMQAWLRTGLAGATVDLQCTDPSGVGDIKGIRIDSDSNDGLDMRVDTDCARYRAGGLRERANLTSPSDHLLLSEELSIIKHDPVFENTLRRMTIWTPVF
ncbi:MAG TPA: glucose-6-phosphate dehydrogenase assembly protein OpcA [Bryobacteraceae bacterium]|nr:glucose-6-phosphate dehydrogenase assembly protein OpcA [Bryobacteraceae bacterium]